MDTPGTLISVVIPCYNQGHYVADAVRSAVSRAYRTEVIVVDDGSTDDTPAAVAGCARARYVRQPNRGLAAARNRGLELAAGDYVVFLDADDQLLPGGLEAGVRALASHPNCAMAYGRCVMMGPDGIVWPTPQQRRIVSGHHAVFLRTNPIWMPAMAIFRRAPLVASGGFSAGFDGAADYDLYLRIARDHAIYDHGALVAAYRRHETSMSGSAGRMLRDTLTVMRRHRPVNDDAQLAAWREGYESWQDFYGTQLTEEIRAHVARHEFVRAAAKAAALGRYAPAVLRREARRKARVAYAGRAIPAAEMSAASRRAEI